MSARIANSGRTWTLFDKMPVDGHHVFSDLDEEVLGEQTFDKSIRLAAFDPRRSARGLFDR